MNNSKHQVMICGACAIVVDEDGQLTTSIDRLVAGIKRLVSRASHARPARATATTVL